MPAADHLLMSLLVDPASCFNISAVCSPKRGAGSML